MSYFANLNEYNYSKEYQDPDIMPVIKKYIFGWIIIQKKGEPIKTKNFLSPFKKFGIRLSPETTEVKQYCYYKGKTLIVDYGDDSTIKDLKSTLTLRRIKTYKSH